MVPRYFHLKLQDLLSKPIVSQRRIEPSSFRSRRCILPVGSFCDVSVSRHFFIIQRRSHTWRLVCAADYRGPRNLHSNALWTELSWRFGCCPGFRQRNDQGLTRHRRIKKPLSYRRPKWSSDERETRSLGPPPTHTHARTH